MNQYPPVYRPALIKRLLKEHGLRPKKGWGQNFLADGNTVARILAAIDPQPDEWIIEIGPGLGALTQGILAAGARVVAVEKDRGLARLLQQACGHEDALSVIVDDALQVDLRALLPTPDTPCKVAGNLPYYITTPLLMHVLESDLNWTRLVVMVQKEVAQRLVAPPGGKEYGALTVAVQYRARVQRVGSVPPTVFYPEPSVDSEIVLISPKGRKPDVGEERIFFAVVKAAFGQRRKTLRNALKRLAVELSGDASTAVGRVDEALSKAGIDGQRRGESLSVDEFARLSREMSEMCV